MSIGFGVSRKDPPTDTEDLRRVDAEDLSWGDTVHYVRDPVMVTGCQDGTVHDDGGNRYVDTGMWHSSCNFGYRNQVIERAVARQLGTLPQVSGDHLHREKLLLAREVVRAVEERTGVKGRVSFSVGGSLAVEDALKIVRKHTGKNRVGVFTGSYHGRSLGTLSLSSSHRYRRYFNEFPDRAVMFPFANCSHCFYEKRPEDCALYCGRMVRKSFSNEHFGLATADSSELGALFVEPCQGRGYSIPPRGFYREFVEEARDRGMLIVADEIQVGMYRTGKLFAFEHFGFVPDVITLGKSLTNGLSPLSLTWARADLLDPRVVTPGHTHSNFANHPLGTAAGYATWRYMLSQDYERTVPERGARYLAGLRALVERHPFVRQTDGLGLLLNLVLADERGRPYRGAASRAVEIGQREDLSWHGEPWRIMLSAGGYDQNVLKFAPYLDIPAEEIDRSLGLLDQVLTRLGPELTR
ncbi:aspartate aminotransferase family protein [Streptomyces sp. JNUCC 64]